MAVAGGSGPLPPALRDPAYIGSRLDVLRPIFEATATLRNSTLLSSSCCCSSYYHNSYKKSNGLSALVYSLDIYTSWICCQLRKIALKISQTKQNRSRPKKKIKKCADNVQTVQYAQGIETTVETSGEWWRRLPVHEEFRTNSSK